VLREDIVGERGELQKKLDSVRKQFDLPEEIQAYRECVQERGFRVGRRERGRARQSEARCKHELSLDLRTKGESNI
jgi:hypothetical protein